MRFCSIDNLTLVGNMSVQSDDFIKIISNMHEVSYINPAKYPYKQTIHFVNHSVILQVAEYGSEIPDLRLEFNPNKVTVQEMSLIMFLIKDIKITRYDVAIDLQEDLSEWTILTNNTNSRRRYWGRDGRVQTDYIGTQRSKVMYRIYDKNKEQGIKSKVPWWRVEEQIRPELRDNILPDTLFKSLHMVKPTENMDIIDKAVIYYLRENPAAWNELTPHLRRKYKAMESFKMFRPTLNDIYRKEIDLLRAELAGWLTLSKKQVSKVS